MSLSACKGSGKFDRIASAGARRQDPDESRESMSDTLPDAKFQSQFEEIGQLAEGLRLGAFDEARAAAALRRIYEIMSWPVATEAPGSRSTGGGLRRHG